LKAEPVRRGVGVHRKAGKKSPGENRKLLALAQIGKRTHVSGCGKPKGPIRLGPTKPAHFGFLAKYAKKNGEMKEGYAIPTRPRPVPVPGKRNQKICRPKVDDMGGKI